MQTRCVAVWLALFLVLLGVCSAQDPCKFDPVFTNGASAAYVSQVKTCFDSIPSTASWRTNTISTMLYLASLYSFTPLAKNSLSSGSSYNMNVDLEGTLEAMKTSSFTSEWDFHNKMAALWRSVHDAHTFYNAPAPYNKFILTQPFSLAAKTVDSNIKIWIEGIYLTWYTSLTGISVSQHVGKTISTINGISAFQWLQTFSDQFYISKDPGVRFNSGLQGGFMEQNIGTIDLPSGNALDFVFEGDSTTYSLPWIVFIAGSFTSTSNFVSYTPNPNFSETQHEKPVRVAPNLPMDPVMAIHETPKPMAKFAVLLPMNSRLHFPRVASPMEPVMAIHEPAVPVARDAQLVSSPKSRNAPVRKPKDVKSLLAAVKENPDAYPANADGVRMINQDINYGLTVIAVSSTGETAYMMQNDTAIIALSTFAPSSSSGVSIGACKSTIQFAISDAIGTRNIDKLLLDLRGNGGGLVCLSYGLQRVLVKDWYENKHDTYGVYDFRKNALYDQIIGSTFVPYSSFLNPDDGEQFSDSGFYTDGPNYTRGGVSGQYTKKWFMNCDGQGITTAGDMWISNDNQQYFKKIAILTDGLCGSACSQAETNLHTRGGAKVITIGGLPNTKPETSSFAGGAVYDWPSFVQRVNYYTSPSNPPKYLPTTAFTRFNFFECYMPPKTATLPREFLKQDSDFHLERWDFGNHEAVYAAAVAFDWQIDSSDAAKMPSPLLSQVVAILGLLLSVLVTLFV